MIMSGADAAKFLKSHGWEIGKRMRRTMYNGIDYYEYISPNRTRILYTYVGGNGEYEVLVFPIIGNDPALLK